jgi:hypothetical protein
MWVKIRNKIINLNTGIYIEIEDILTEHKKTIYLKRLGYKTSIIIYESTNKRKVYLIFKKIRDRLLRGKLGRKN